MLRLRDRKQQKVNGTNKLNLRTKKALPQTPFQKLVQEAIDVTRKLRALETPKSPNAKALTAEAFLRETVSLVGGSTPERARKLHKLLTGSNPGFEHTRRTFRIIQRQLKEPTIRTPPDHASLPRIERWLGITGDTNAELAASGFNTVELIGAAVVALEKTDIWGDADSTEGAEDEISELTAEQERLFRQIECAYTAADLDVGGYVRGQGATPARFKGTDVEIAGDNPGKRLIDYLISHSKENEAR